MSARLAGSLGVISGAKMAAIVTSSITTDATSAILLRTSRLTNWFLADCDLTSTSRATAIHDFPFASLVSDARIDPAIHQVDQQINRGKYQRQHDHARLDDVEILGADGR